MLNFLSPPPSPASGKQHLFFLVVVIVIFVLCGVITFFSVEHYVATRWLSFAEQIGKKISVANWWSAPREVPPVAPIIPHPVRRSDSKSLDPNLFSARHMVVRDDTTGEMLFGKAAYEPWPIASITKLLSAMVLLDTPLDFSATTTAARDVVYDNEIIPQQVYKVGDLWGAALVASSNRAILSLVDASGISREEFVVRMNKKALDLGLTNTKVFEPTGLDPRNTATAADIAILVSEALKKTPIRDTVLLSEYTIATADGRFEKKLRTTDWLVSGLVSKSGLEIRGGKTGTIPEADYNFALQVSSSTGRVLDVVILGAENNDARFVEARRAAEWVYRSYEWK
jgi:D-alanyl-D-alanine endopeptidase (penicillin-binding protein 7)